MQKELSDDIHVNCKKYEEKIVDSIQNELYQYECYKVNLAFL